MDELIDKTVLFTWVILPFLIFIARIADVSLDTVRIILVARGYKYIAPLVGFFEVLIWLGAITQIMNNLKNPLCYIAYAGGFAMGNYIGMCIANKLSLGVVLVRIVTGKEATTLIDSLKAAEYGVTTLEAQGIQSKVNLIFTVVPRREVDRIVKLINVFNPNAFFSIEEIHFVNAGVYPQPKSWKDFTYKDFFRRAGK
ncbi:MAG: DUF2179 domain-containing protein [Sedimentisphaerales bacterium]|nr:DUF2179 domain-containing protein [Sedimentisphaerales bacterium]